MSQPIAKYRPKRSPIVAIVKPFKKEGNFGALALTAEEGLLHFAPVPFDDGTNDTHLLKGKSGDYVAVFKTADDPLLQDNGDSATVDHGLSPSEMSLREVAAYKLDRKGFFGVPTTGIADISYSGFVKGELVSESPVVVRKRTGSLQEFINNDGSAEDASTSRFPTSSVHRLAILDIQLLNGDRHEGNILIQKSQKGVEKLIPIDHGLSLPRKLDKCWFCWLTWPQAKAPFGEEELEYIRSIDIDKDVRVLRNLGIDEVAISNFRLASLLLQKAADSGLTAYDIGSMMCRVKGLEVPSELEKTLAQAKLVTMRMVNPREMIRGDTIISTMLTAKAKKVAERRNLIPPHKLLLRDHDDDQIAMSQYPNAPRPLVKFGLDCSRALRRASSPLSSPLMRI